MLNAHGEMRWIEHEFAVSLRASNLPEDKLILILIKIWYKRAQAK